MNWQEVCQIPYLQHIPFKVELEEGGRLLMSPVSLQHVKLQSKIQSLLSTLLKGGEVFCEFPLQITKPEDTGEETIKIPDVVWISYKRIKKIPKRSFASPIPPEICVEVLSPRNTSKEMLEKQRVYFEKGALEFWVCDNNGNMDFYNKEGQLKHSELVPNFPKKIKPSF